MHLALILIAKIVTIIVPSKNFKGFSEKPLTAATICYKPVPDCGAAVSRPQKGRLGGRTSIFPPLVHRNSVLVDEM